jgi:SAM-dependent methyltransferase
MGVARDDPEHRYLQHTSAGADYFNKITALEADQRTRAAFCTLVLRIAPPGATLFDFGSGPGIDARFFAERGFAVDAYDVDPRMREFFAQHCRDLIETGNVTLDDRTYREFLTRSGADGARRADLVISNFAPLNLVDDLDELFAKFHSLTGPQGKVLASVLNPLFFGEMRSRWWWRRAPRLWRDGELFLPGPQAPHYRRLLRHFGTASAPHFKLTRVFRELSPLPGTSIGVDLQRHRRIAWLHLARYRFSFLLFEKAPGR